MTSTTSTTPNGDALDDLDRQIILFVARFRRPNYEGPTWNEVRAAVGIPKTDLSKETFAVWLDVPANRDRLAQRRALQTYLIKHAHDDPDVIEKGLQNLAYRLWQANQLDHDPLGRRLRRLRYLKYLRFSDTPRSLCLGPRVRDWQMQRRRVSAEATT